MARPKKEHALGRDGILRRAVDLFGERGVSAVSIRDIAAACDIRSASLYAHFSSREAIVQDAYLSGMSAYTRRLREAMDSETTPRASLYAMIDTVLVLHDEDTARFRFLVVNQHDQIRHVGSTPETNIIVLLTTLVERAIATGELPAQDVNMVALGIAGIIIQQSIGAMFGRVSLPLSAHREAIFALCWRMAGGRIG